MQSSEITNQSIMVTGGAGFIGSNIAKALADKNDVRILDSLSTGSQLNIPDNTTFIEGDIRDQEVINRSTKDVDLIFHKAALVSIQRSIEDPVTSHEINSTATLKLLEAAREQNARVVLASSAAIYGDPESDSIDEEAAKEPTSPYGLNKLVNDHYARQYHNLYNLATVPLRYFNVYGPGQIAGNYSGVISIFIDQALSGEDITVHGEGDQTRDFVFIDDIVHANLKAATTDEVGNAYNIGTGEVVTIRKLAELIQDITDTESDIVHTDCRSGDIDHSRADISNAEDNLGYEPTVSLQDGLEQTVKWYQDQRS